MFFTSKPDVSGKTITGDDQKVTLSDDASVSVEPGYASGTDASLFRARINPFKPASELSPRRVPQLLRER